MCDCHILVLSSMETAEQESLKVKFKCKPCSLLLRKKCVCFHGHILDHREAHWHACDPDKDILCLSCWWWMTCLWLTHELSRIILCCWIVSSPRFWTQTEHFSLLLLISVPQKCFKMGWTPDVWFFSKDDSIFWTTSLISLLSVIW